MSIPPKKTVDYEKVKTDDFVVGIIEEVQEDMEHNFTFTDAKGVKTSKISPAVRFVFKLEGYEFKHFSRWMTFSYGERTNLYTKYLLNLVENATPDMNFDIQQLKGMRVKTLWEGENFQSIQAIKPLESKVVPLEEPASKKTEQQEAEEIPF